jgi:hypothetical protein
VPWKNNQSAAPLLYQNPATGSLVSVCASTLCYSPKKFNHEGISDTKDQPRHPPLVTQARALQSTALLSDGAAPEGLRDTQDMTGPASQGESSSGSQPPGRAPQLWVVQIAIPCAPLGPKIPDARRELPHWEKGGSQAGQIAKGRLKKPRSKAPCLCARRCHSSFDQDPEEGFFLLALDRSRGCRGFQSRRYRRRSALLR